MVTYTNRANLPAPLVALLGRESYTRGDSRRSATQLIDSPRLVAIKEKHQDAKAREVDIADRIFALFGTAVHKLIEDGIPYSDWHMAEERLFAEVRGWKISGAIDLQVLTERSVALIDWKVCGIWSVYSKGRSKVKPEWERQLNLLAFLVETQKPDVRVANLQVGALLRDWKQADAERDPSYPQAPFHMVEVPLWPYDQRKAYVERRVMLHQDAEMALAMGEEPEPCTDDEMWVRDNAWAVIKKGNKRATRVFDNEDAAKELVAKLPEAVIDVRPGERLRCVRYCEAAAFCSLAPKPEGTDPVGF